MTNKTTMPEPVGYFACDPETLEPVWDEGCVCQDDICNQEDFGTIGRPFIFTDQAEAYADAKVREALDRLQGLSNGAYCRYIDTLYRDECLGWEAKVKDGRFGEREFNAYKKAHEFLGQHRAFAEAIITIRALIPTTK